MSYLQHVPHGADGSEPAALVWTHAFSDGLTSLSYWAIAFILVYLVYRANREHAEEAPGLKRLPYPWLFMAFGLFIMACGTVHFFLLWSVWEPVYGPMGVAKVFMAVASVGTAVALPPLVPRVLQLLREARKSEKRQAELRVAHAELRDAHEQVKQYDELKSQFFANVSHELRTPLALILGPVDALLEPERPEDERRQLEVVRRNARLLRRHVDDLLDLSRLEAGRLEPRFARSDLAALVRTTAANFDGLAAERDMSFDVETPPTLPVEVDVDKVRRVLLNLLANAFKFTPAGGTVRVVLSRDGHPDAPRAFLEVRDSGPGIPPEERTAVFERFRQVEGGTTRRFGGTGLGLAITKEFVDLHHGKVRVEEAPEGGAALIVELPLRAPEHATVLDAEEVDSHADDEAAVDRLAELEGFGALGPAGDDPGAGVAGPGGRGADPGARHPGAASGTPAPTTDPGTLAPASGQLAPGPAPGARHRAGGTARSPGDPAAAPPRPAQDRPDPDRPHVLVVEDNPEMLRFLAERLEEEAYRVSRAGDGVEALLLLEEEPPDLVLTDVMMPRMSGDRLLREARQRAELSDVPFVVLTAKADDELRIRLLREGAQDYLLKPCAMEEVRARVGNLVRQKRSVDMLRRALRVRAGDLETLSQRIVDSRNALNAALDEARIARSRAEAASRAKSEFLAVMSHELRTPLNAILGYNELLSAEIAGPMTAEQSAHTRRVGANARHLLEMIDEILTLARRDAFRDPIEPREADLAEVVDQAVEPLELEAETKGLRLIVHPPAGPAPIRTDFSKLRHVVSNLLSNAIKFTEEGEVELTAAVEEEEIVIRVRDTGVGIRREHQERVFDVFWQAESGPIRTVGGAGLGLAISHQFVRLLGGSIQVESAPTVGSTFTVRVPARVRARREENPDNGNALGA